MQRLQQALLENPSSSNMSESARASDRRGSDRHSIHSANNHTLSTPQPSSRMKIEIPVDELEVSSKPEEAGVDPKAKLFTSPE